MRIVLFLMSIFAFGWFSNTVYPERNMIVYICLGGAVLVLILNSALTFTSLSSSKVKMTPPASQMRKNNNRKRSISKDLEKNNYSNKTVLDTIMEMNRKSEISRGHDKLHKFSQSVDLEVENFTKRLMKNQSESPDIKIKLKLPKGALEKMKRFSLKE